MQMHRSSRRMICPSWKGNQRQRRERPKRQQSAWTRPRRPDQHQATRKAKPLADRRGWQQLETNCQENEFHIDCVRFVFFILGLLIFRLLVQGFSNLHLAWVWMIHREAAHIAVSSRTDQLTTRPGGRSASLRSTSTLPAAARQPDHEAAPRHECGQHEPAVHGVEIRCIRAACTPGLRRVRFGTTKVVTAAALTTASAVTTLHGSIGGARWATCHGAEVECMPAVRTHLLQNKRVGAVKVVTAGAPTAVSCVTTLDGCFGSAQWPTVQGAGLECAPASCTPSLPKKGGGAAWVIRTAALTTVSAVTTAEGSGSSSGCTTFQGAGKVEDACCLDCSSCAGAASGLAHPLPLRQAESFFFLRFLADGSKG